MLTRNLPPNAALVSASVASWKTEDIGFEVSGRVEFVAEPNTEIEGRIADREGHVVLEGTPIGRLESERYRLAVQRAEAEITRAEQNLLASETELSASIPAQFAAAQSARQLAKIEYERSQRLFAQKAGAKADVDRDKANYQNAISQLKQLEAAKSGQEAQIESLKSGVLQAEQNLRDAERNLEDCTLYSSFRGQIAEVSAVPGTVVNAGEPIATLQMMDPIKVELEVSTDESRRLQQREVLPVNVTMPNGKVERREGYLYLIDPVADPLTRTFTVTLLVMNERLTQTTDDDNVARTRDLWRLNFKFLPGAEENMLFIEEGALLEDETGHYIWQITNTTIGSYQPDQRLLKVRKARVSPRPLKIPFLGNWVFQQIELDDEKINPKLHMAVGALIVSEGEPDEWDGDTVLLESGGQWMLRPGDLVKVNLSGGATTTGYYVPMDAIVKNQDLAYIFAVDDSGDHAVAKRIPIRIVENGSAISSARLIESADGTALEGLHYIVEGAHYLIDGEPVNQLTAVGVVE